MCFAAALCMILGVFTGCKDQSEDIIGKVGETPIYRWYYESRLINQLALQNKYNGVDITAAANSAKYESFKQSMLLEVATEAAMWEEARVQGLADLNDAQEAEIDQLYNKYFNRQIESYMDTYGHDDDGRKKAEQAYLDTLKTSNLTPERVRESLRYSYIANLLVTRHIEEDPITEDDLLEVYNDRLQSQQANYSENPLLFAKDVSDSTAYIPEGYYDTARIMLKFTPKQQQQIAEAYQARTAALMDFTQATLEKGENSMDANRASAAIDRTSANFNKVMEQCHADLEKSMQTILDDIHAGADFIATMEQKSEDTHLISYYVCEGADHVEEPYLTAALALQNEGDVSGIVRLEQGVCIIRLMEKLTPGVRPFEEVREALRSELNRALTLSVTRDLQAACYEAADEAGLVELHTDMV